MIGAVVLLAAGVLGFFAWRLRERSGLFDEGTRMQRLYVALSIYESQDNEQIPPDLTGARIYLGSDRDYVSDWDPFRTAAGPFPVDAGLPSGRKSAPFRVSDTYLWAHRLAGRIKTQAWAEARLDPTLGVLASEWHGSVQTRDAFEASVSGLVLRITTDGSLVKVKRGGPKPLGDAQDLFRAQPERR